MFHLFILKNFKLIKNFSKNVFNFRKLLNIKIGRLFKNDSHLIIIQVNFINRFNYKKYLYEFI